ncbi:MAG: hypothetical protein SOW25_03890 [Helicobacter sp.]|nr:hypothetical protein [Helicobacteraceae bacterium]MDY3113452.1 hypothetical protein [Helicobacter sp.]
MAFKINTDIFKPAQSTITKQDSSKKESTSTQAQPTPQSTTQNLNIKKHPSYNLLDKYTNQASFLNGLSGISNATNNKDSIAEEFLLQFLQGQNNALDNLGELSKLQLDSLESKELENFIKEKLQENSGDDFLSILLTRIQNGF